MSGFFLKSLLVAAALGAAAASLPAGATDEPPAADARSAITSGGSYRVTYETDEDRLPLNEMVEIRFRVFHAGGDAKPVEGAVVTADAYMPLHKHGTNLQPRVESHGDGSATGRGFLLHMEGRWELRVGVAAEGRMERATFEILLEP